MSLRDRLKAAGFSLQAAEAAAHRYGSLAEIAHAHPDELVRLGVSRRVAARTVAAMKIGLDAMTHAPRVDLHDPIDIHRLLRARVGALTQEAFFVIAVSIDGQLIAWAEIALGSLFTVEVHPREVFRYAIKMNAAAVILAHNHPSGMLLQASRTRRSPSTWCASVA